MTHFPCVICETEVHYTDKALACDNCNMWIHLKFHKLIDLDYKWLQKGMKKGFCILCILEIFTIFTRYNKEENCSILTKPTVALIKINKHLPDNSLSNLLDCKHRDNKDNMYFQCLSDQFKTFLTILTFVLFKKFWRSLHTAFLVRCKLWYYCCYWVKN